MAKAITPMGQKDSQERGVMRILLVNMEKEALITLVMDKIQTDAKKMSQRGIVYRELNVECKQRLESLREQRKRLIQTLEGRLEA